MRYLIYMTKECYAQGPPAPTTLKKNIYMEETKTTGEIPNEYGTAHRCVILPVVVERVQR